MKRNFFFSLMLMLTGNSCIAQTISRLNFRPLRPDSIVSFYNEMDVQAPNYKSPGKFIACGFADGYLGLRINANRERSAPRQS